MAYLYLTGNSTPEWGNFSQEDTVIEIFCPKQLAELNAGWSDLPTRLGYLGFALLEPCLGCESLIPSLCISVVSLFRPHSACVGLCWIHEEFQRSKSVCFFQNSMQPLPYCCRGSVSGSVPPGDWTFCALLSAPQVHTFRGPHWCEYCANFMWGLIAQGVRCSGRHKTLSSSRYIKCHLVEWEATFRARDCAWMSSEIQLV